MHDQADTSVRSKRRRPRVILVLLLAVAVLAAGAWWRIQGPSRTAVEFVEAVQVGEFDRAGELLSPRDQPLPGRWADPAHWGEAGALGCDAYVRPLSLGQIWAGERYVQATVAMDAEPPVGVLQHTFRATSTSFERVPGSADAHLYPVTVRRYADAVMPEIPEDIQDVPATDVRVEGDPKKRYFLIGLDEAAQAPPGGYRLLVVLPGGDGGEAFSPFIRRMHKQALPDGWLVAQMVAPSWDARQKRVNVWPTEKSRYPGAAFTTETFFDAMIADVQARARIDPAHIYLLAWSSGGPPAYAISLREDSPVAGAFIAMSVSRVTEAGKPNAAGKSFYLLQSPDDKVTRFSEAQKARAALAAAGARVHLENYAGGHGWRGPVWDMISDGITWLQGDAAKP